VFGISILVQDASVIGLIFHSNLMTRQGIVMTGQETRGVQTSQEIRDELRVKDARPFMVKMIDWMKVPNNLGGVMIFLGFLAFLIPAVGDICLLVTALLFWFGITREEYLPIKFPKQSGARDKNEPNFKDKKKPGDADGIFFLGNDIKTGKEVWLTNSDCRQHFLLLGTTGTGKALPLDADVHTPLGWKKMADIRVGDLVTTPDGRSAPVTGYYPQGKLDIYRVTFEDGRVAEACGEHLWEVHHKHWNGKYKPGVSRAGKARPRLLRTHDIKALLERNSGAFSVRLSEAVQKPQTNLSIEPYLMGALLGDGGISGDPIRLSSVDGFIVEKVAKQLAAVGYALHPDDYAAACDYRIRAVEPKPGHLSFLRALGLEGTKSETKFIPEAYREGSIEQRWALVQGLMDTDGTVDSRTGSLSYSSSSKQLAEDFQYVVRSLGGLAKISEKASSYRDADGAKVEGKTSYRVSIRHPEPEQFFSLPRKLELVPQNYQYKETLKLRIRSVELSRQADAACILVDHADHLFITNDYVVTHNTEALLGFASNAVSWGSGFLFIDGKGDVSTFASIYSLARRFGREDDLLVLNYMTGNQDVGSGGGKLRSNTMNPFSHGASDTLTNMVVSLMDEVGGDGAMWKGRATAMFTGVMRALTWLRDENRIDLNVAEIRDHLNLKRIIDLADEKKYPDLPAHIRHNVRSYLTSLPGYQEEKLYKQGQTTLDQHGYLEMQFTRVLGSLADVYGYIFQTPFGEIDMSDVVLNRRMVLIMLPALEKASDEIANLGKIVVATLRGMMGSTLGSEIEGSWQDVVENRLTKSPSPFIVILDEVGYYMVDGMDLMAAQARSLGFSLVFAGQDLNAMKRISEKVFGSVLGNTRTKVLLGTEDTETMELASKLGGKALRTHGGGFTGQVKEFGKAYSDNNEARVEEIERINARDIKGQGAGEAHILHGDHLVRVNMFYADPKSTLNPRKLLLRTNHFITVGHPNVETILSQQKLPEIVEKMCDPEFASMMRTDADNAQRNVALGGELQTLYDAMKAASASDKISNVIDKSIIGFAQVAHKVEMMTETFSDTVKQNIGVPKDTPATNFAGSDPVLADPSIRRARNIANPQQQAGQGTPGGRPEPSGGNNTAPPLLPAVGEPVLRKPDKTTFKINPVRSDVEHGFSIEGGPVNKVAEAKLAGVPDILDALSQLDFEASKTNKEDVDRALNDALEFGDETDDIGPVIPATGNDLRRADTAIGKAMPEPQFEFDESDDDSGSEDTTIDFLGALLQTEE
jgi:intracellular multiplication protein IcmO